MNGTLGRLRRRLLRSAGSVVHGHVLGSRSARVDAASRDPPYRGHTVPPAPHPPTDTDPLRPRATGWVDRPVLTAGDVTDFGDTEAVADPFLFVTDAGDWHMFFEVYDGDREPTAAIAHATSADAGRTWQYDRVVLATDVHLSFPYVFRHAGEHYMLPDPWSKTDRQAPITLYRARSFPTEWTPVAEVLSPERPMHDCVLFHRDGRWWALVGDQQNLYVYHSEALEADGWRPHEANPVVQGRPSAARPAGRPVVRPEYVLVFLQDCARRYGHRVRAYRVTELSASTYTDHEVPESPVLEPRNGRFGWNSGATHHVDPWYVGDRWRCAVDGNVDLGVSEFGDMWAIGVYESR